MTLHEQIHVVFQKTGWTVAKLLDKSGLALDQSSLHRKLHGNLPMKTGEAEAIASALCKHGFRVTLMWPPKKKPRARAA